MTTARANRGIKLVVVFILLAAVGSVAALSAADWLTRSELVEVNFASIADARQADYVGPDRRIPFLPESARDIREAHNMESNNAWMRFGFAGTDSALLLEGRERLTPDQARLRMREAPSAIRWWNEEMRTLRADPRFFSEIYVRRVRGASECLFANWTSRIAYVWTCHA